MGLGSGSFAALILPLVIAGCEAVNAHDRSVTFQCLQGLRNSSLCDLDQILELLKVTWRLRDEKLYRTGLEWQEQSTFNTDID